MAMARQVTPPRWPMRTFRLRLRSIGCYVAAIAVFSASGFAAATEHPGAAATGIGVTAVLAALGACFGRSEIPKEIRLPLPPKSPPVIWGRSRDQ